MTSSIVALGDLVRQTRKERHLSQKELAEQIGVCKRTIIDIEMNIGNPKFDVLYSLIRELELPIYQIFYPEIPAYFEEKAKTMEEINDCSLIELRMLLPLIQSLKRILRTEYDEDSEAELEFIEQSLT